MNKKFNKKNEYASPSGTKFNLAVFSNESSDLFSATDESKTIFIWKRAKESPVLSLCNNSSLITSIILNHVDPELYSGSQTGQIVVWDLESGSVKFNLQGHSTTCTAMKLAKINNKSSFLVSASLDGKLKVWDLRMRTAMLNFKGHGESIRTLSISPDCSMIASGGDDSLVKIWDIGQQKLVKTLSITDQGAINSLEFNPINYSLAYSCNDKTIKHWDLEQQKLICISPVDKSVITKVKFDATGKNIYALTNERFKFLYMDEENVEILDQFETAWNKPYDFTFDKTNLSAISILGTKLSFWQMPIAMLKPYQNEEEAGVGFEYQEVKENKKAKDDKSAMMSNVQKNIKDLRLLENRSSDPGEEDYGNSKQKSKVDRKSSNQYGAGTNAGASVARANDRMDIDSTGPGNGIGNGDDFNDINNFSAYYPHSKNQNESDGYTPSYESSSTSQSQTNVKPNASKTKPTTTATTKQNSNKNLENSLAAKSIVNLRYNEPMGLDMSEFNDNQNDVMDTDLTTFEEEINDFDLINEITEQQNVFMGAINKRLKSMKILHKFWSDDINNAINGLSMMKDLGLSEINDFFNGAFVGGDVVKLPLTTDNVQALLPNAIKLMSSKYEAHIKTGILTSQNFLKMFSERITTAKKVPITGGIDMAREDRMKKYDSIVESYEEMYKLPNLIKISKKTSQNDVVKLAIQLLYEIETFIATCRKNEEIAKKY